VFSVTGEPIAQSSGLGPTSIGKARTAPRAGDHPFDVGFGFGVPDQHQTHPVILLLTDATFSAVAVLEGGRDADWLF
jgi:hypothetical protein